VEVLVINALHHRPHHSHFTLDQTLEVIKQVSPKSTYIIHMSHYMGLYEDVQAKLPQNVYLAYDQLKLDLMV
jgi:phosphoribosyl 1,2-cyclic phosphate phosphodiesterase